MSIFEYAFDDGGDRGTLAVLARTCTTFQDPALAIFWRDMDSLFPLIKCLPAGCWQERENANSRTLVSDIFLLYRRCIANTYGIVLNDRTCFI